jgi:hypothetical protein
VDFFVSRLATMASTLRVGRAFKGMRDNYVVVKQVHSHVWTARSLHASLITGRVVLRPMQELVAFKGRASNPPKPGESHSEAVLALPAHTTNARPRRGPTISGSGTPGHRCTSPVRRWKTLEIRYQIDRSWHPAGFELPPRKGNSSYR